MTSFATSLLVTWLPGESTMAMPAETGSPSTPPAPMRRIVRPRTTLFGALRMPTPLRRKSVILPLPRMRTRAWPSFAIPSLPFAFVPESV